MFKILFFFIIFVGKYFNMKYGLFDLDFEDFFMNINQNFVNFYDSFGKNSNFQHFAERQPKVPEFKWGIPDRGDFTLSSDPVYKKWYQMDGAKAYKLVLVVWAIGALYFIVTDWFFWHNYYLRFPPR